MLPNGTQSNAWLLSALGWNRHARDSSSHQRICPHRSLNPQSTARLKRCSGDEWHTRPKNIPIQNQTTLWGLPPVEGHFPCGNCSVCPQTRHTKEVDLGLTRPWRQHHHTNCNTNNCIYVIECPCHKRYVGMTTRSVKLRICEHKSTIRCRKTLTKFQNHYLELNHSAENLEWTVIDHNNTWSRQTLHRYEQRWVFRLKSHVTGLNDDIPWAELRY